MKGFSHRRRVVGGTLVIGLLLTMLLGMMPAASATPVINWYPVNRPGQLETDRYTWTEVSRQADFGFKPGARTNYDTMPAVFASDHDPVAGYPWPYCQPVEDCPFRAGVFATLSEANAGSGNNASGWQSRVRVNSEDDQGARPAMACDEADQGKTCDIAFVKQSSYYDSKVGKGPRSLWVAHSPDWGYSNSYGIPVEITSPNGKVDYPSIDVSSGKIHLTWTDGKTGEVMLAISADGGLTWTKKVVAKTTREAYGPYPYADGGYEARPAIAVTDDGQTIAIAYFKKSWRWDATIRVKLSQDGGATWTSKRLAKGGANPNPHYANVPTGDGVAGRVAFAWTNGEKVFTREFDAVAGQWQPKRSAATLPMGIYKNVDSTGIGLYGPGRVGVSFGGCLAKNCPLWGSSAKGKDLLYTESDDNGLTWSEPQVIKTHDETFNFVNEMGTVVFANDNVRYVRYNSGSADGYQYELQVAVGTLAP